MPQLINWELLAQPYNWIIVIVMLLIGVWALHALREPMGLLPGII